MSDAAEQAELLAAGAEMSPEQKLAYLHERAAHRRAVQRLGMRCEMMERCRILVSERQRRYVLP